jgi:hypothetical protein
MDSEIINDELAVEEQLDLSEDEHELKKHEEVLADLQAIYVEIENKASVNKTLAAAIESIRENTLTDKTPLNSFTKELSKTNLKASLEDIIDGIIATIKFIFKTIFTIIGKIFGFIKRLFFRAKEKEKINESLLLKSKENVDEVVLLKSKIGNADHAIYDKVFKIISTEANEQLKLISNDLFKDTITSGSVKNILLSIGTDINKYMDKINSKMVLLNKAIKESKNNNITEINIILSDADKYIKNGNSNSIISSNIKNGINGTMANDLVLVKDHVYNLEESKTLNAFNYQLVFDMVRTNKIKLTDIFLSDTDMFEKNVKTLQDKSESTSSIVDKLKSSKEIQAHIKDSLIIVKEEIAALQYYFLCVNKIISVNTSIVNFLYNHTNAHYKMLLSEMRNGSDTTTKNAVKESIYKSKK